MEKISNIVRGSSRVASVDLKSSSAVRPGAPSYGRSVGENSASTEREGTTASRAAALHLQMSDQRRSSQDRVVEAMADNFFMSRIRRPAEVEVGPVESKEPALSTREAVGSAPVEDSEGPEGYTPRGSFVDVQA